MTPVRTSHTVCVCFQYGDEFAWSEIENVWTTLADSWPKNLKIILHFLISISGVNSEPSLLTYVSATFGNTVTQKSVFTVVKML